MSKRKLEAAQLVHKKLKLGDEDDKPVPFGKVGQKQRTLMFANRGITGHGRHLMNDLRVLVPACKKESKLSSKGDLSVINEMCEVSACNNAVFFEQRGNDLFMWVAKAPNGPSLKFLVLNGLYSAPYICNYNFYLCKNYYFILKKTNIYSTYLLFVHNIADICKNQYFIFAKKKTNFGLYNYHTI